jgi:peptidoglycan/xylan/chitin deacetylase (PgdA/CDA1 family)
MLIAVNFHYIRHDFDAPYEGIYGVTPQQFENQLNRLSKLGQFVSSEGIENAILNGNYLPEKGILVTFDDGLKEQFEIALPVLDKMGIPALFYLNTSNLESQTIASVHKIHLLLANMPYHEYSSEITLAAAQLFDKTSAIVNKDLAIQHYYYDDPERAILKYFLNFCFNILEQNCIIDLLFEKIFPGLEKILSAELYMNQEQVKQLAKRRYLGSHAHSHIPLGLYEDRTIQNDIKRSQEIIKNITGMDAVSISYPYGSKESSGLNVQKIAKENGFVFGFTMERAGNSDFAQPLGLARFDCNDLPGGKFPLFEDKDLFSRIKKSSWFS